MMPSYSLEDLVEDDGRFYFPNSPIGRSRRLAEEILIVCNYTGVLTDTITPTVIVKLIKEIEKLKERMQ